MLKMKKALKITLVIALCLVGYVRSNAQAKFGHINSAELLSMMPEIKDADKKLQDFGASLEAQLKTMTNEYQTKVQDYQSKEASMADPIKQSKIKEITDLEGRIQEFRESAQESVSKKKEELYTPILKKAEDAIVSLAKEKGFAYVFDTSIGATIYAQESDNMMESVKKKLGIPADAVPPSKAGAAQTPVTPKK
jgi:outer membrane protein